MVETNYQIPGAPRIALLTDLHNRPCRSIIDRVSAQHPDMIAVAGDIIYGVWPEGNRSPLEMQENVMPFLRACAGIAPTFLSLGNHEQSLDRADLQAIMDTGVIVLDNDYRQTFIGGKTMVIGGLTSAYVTDYRKATRNIIRTPEDRYPKKQTIDGWDGLVNANDHRPELDWLEEFAAKDAFHILLSHHPEYFPFVPDAVELVLSGHVHGGQWRIFGHGVFAPGQGFFPKYAHGVYDGRLVVSAGLSNTSWIPRFFNPTEIVYIN